MTEIPFGLIVIAAHRTGGRIQRRGAGRTPISVVMQELAPH